MKGEQLKEARDRTGLDQVTYAAKLGIHPISLSRYERDRQPIPTLVELAACELARRLKPAKKPASRTIPTKRKPKK